MDKVKVGIVGMGMGRHHGTAFNNNPAAELAAVCDMNEEKLRQQAGELEVKQTYTDAAKMFAEAGLDAVTIATPNKFHAPLTIAALEAGLHVLCEKPMAMTVAEAEAMKAAAVKTGKNLMINFSFRYTSASQALKNQIDAGVLGDIYFGRSVWHRRRGMPGFGGWFSNKALSGGGPLIDLGVHRLDLALWLMGYPDPMSVTGSTFNPIASAIAAEQKKDFTVEDLACGMIRFAGGQALILEASWAANIKEKEQMSTRLYGTRGGMFQYNVEEGYRFEAEIYTEENGALFDKKLKNPGRHAVPSSYDEFISCILENRQPDATADHGIKVMKILEGIYKSAETGREIRYGVHKQETAA